MKAGKPIIGVVGGIGSGKSTVAAILGDLGAAVVGSDRLNHEELASPEVQACLREWWGDSIIRSDGQTDREAIRKRVHADGAALKRLERLVHPRIARRREALTAQYQADPSVPAIVWDSPLLYEAGLARKCDCVIFVEADEATRLDRVSRGRGWTAQELGQFEQSQRPLDFKRAGADYRVVNNSGTDDLRRQVEEIFSRILSGSQDS